MRLNVPRFQHLEIVVVSHGLIKLTTRHLTVLLLAGLAGLNLWPLLAPLALWAHIAVVSLAVLLVLPFGWVRLAGRPLEQWTVIFLRYWTLPHLYVSQLPRKKQRQKSASPVTKSLTNS